MLSHLWLPNEINYNIDNMTEHFQNKITYITKIQVLKVSKIYVEIA